MKTSKTSERKSRSLLALDATTRGAADQANEREMKQNVVGQDEAVQAALDAVARAKNPLRDKSRPIAIIYELGPSRSGKTLIAQMIAKILHGDPKAMVKINGGNYKERHEVARLIGAPPGYLGHKPGDEEKSGKETATKSDKHAKLTRKNLIASRKGSKTAVSVVLIDEANLMHTSFDDVMMSIMDQGELDMGNNEVTDFTDCIIILTSNLGMDEVHRKARKGIGFLAEEKKKITFADIESTVKEALSDRYRPEWLNRVDRFVIFHPHTEEALFQIVDMELEKFVQRMEKELPRGSMFTLDVDDTAKRFLLVSAMADNGNIAQLKREMQRHLIDALGNLMAKNAIEPGAVVVVQHSEGASSLSFFLAEGESAHSAADGIEVARETDESQEGLAQQRRLDRERRTQVKPQEWDITLESRSEDLMIRSSHGFMADLTNIYGMEILFFGFSRVSPWIMKVTVKATAGQIEVFNARHAKDKKTKVERPA